MNYDSIKMRELILYFARNHGDTPPLGRVKMAKLLFYADNETYRETAYPITGAQYRKRPHGPAAAQYEGTFGQMQIDKDAHEEVVGKGFRIVADRDADMSLFNDDEKRIMADVLDKYRAWSAQQISDASHREVGWRVATPDKEIPYEAFLLAPTVTTEHKERGAKIVAVNGWALDPF